MLEALIFAAYMEIGYLPLNEITSYDAENLTEHVDLSQCFYLDLDAEVTLFDIFWIGGGMKCYSWQQRHAFMGGWPQSIDYRVRAGITFGCLTVGFRHQCRHPAVPYIQEIGPIRFAHDSASEEVFLRLETGR